MLAALANRIAREGPVRFDTAMEAMLYGDGGFFAGGGGAGRRADFLTSPEVGPLFGAVVAGALDAEWRRLGCPDPFVVVEAGAGRGALAKAVLDAGLACGPALRYLCVERSAALRDQALDLLPIEPISDLFGAVVVGDDPDDDRAAVPGSGPLVGVLDELPHVPVTGVVLANELLDNIAFRLLERTVSGWDEVLVGLDATGALIEVPIAAPDDVAAEADRLAPGAEPGSRIPLQHHAMAWLRDAFAALCRGRVLLFDYADTTPSLARRAPAEWLRTYRAHSRGAGPLDEPGRQDVTCEVAIDQLARVKPLDRDRSQADWLRANGLDALVAAAAATWHERAAIGDLEALQARSRVGEADALTDPSGLGAFRVLEWVVDG